VSALVPVRPSPHLRRYGHDTVAPQGLAPELQHWFDADGFVAFVDTGTAWVAAGSPIAPAERLATVAARFTDAARARGRRACFFGVERPLVDAGAFALAIGEHPVWDAWRWSDVLATSSSLRYQVRRAFNHEVRVRPRSEGEPLDAMRAVITRWQSAHAMPPMGFLADLDAAAVTRTRRILVAERRGQLVGFAGMLTIPSRQRVFIEHLIRAPGAPNGTAELLVDSAMREAGGCQLTLGLAPLSGSIPRWMRLTRWLGTPLYDFAGLRAFKEKLRPHTWEPVYLCTVRGSLPVALLDSLRAFAGGSLLAFASRWARRAGW